MGSLQFVLSRIGIRWRDEVALRGIGRGEFGFGGREYSGDTSYLPL